MCPNKPKISLYYIIQESINATQKTPLGLSITKSVVLPLVLAGKNREVVPMMISVEEHWSVLVVNQVVDQNSL